MRTKAEVAFVLDMTLLGISDSEIARRTGIPRKSVGDWRRYGGQHHGVGKNDLSEEELQGDCPLRGESNFDRRWYGYLLGM